MKKLVFLGILLFAFLHQFPYLVPVASILIVPGLLMFVSSNVLLYSLPILAIYYGARGQKPKYGFIVIGIIMAGIIAFLPSLIVRNQINEIADILLSTNFTEPSTLKINSIGFVGFEENIDWRSKQVKCGNVCQELLFYNQIKEVFIKSKYQEKNIRFSIEERDKCPAINSTILQAFSKKVAHGTCLIKNAVTFAKPDALIITSNNHKFDKYRKHSACRWNSRFEPLITKGPFRTLEIFEPKGKEYILIEHRTEMHILAPSAPFVIRTLSCGGTAVAWTTHIANTTIFESSFDIEQVLYRRYGISLKPIKKYNNKLNQHETQETRYRQILSRNYAPNEYISKAESKMVNQFVASILRKKHIFDKSAIKYPDSFVTKVIDKILYSIMGRAPNNGLGKNNEANINTKDIELLRLALKQRALIQGYGFTVQRYAEFPELVPLIDEMISRVELPIVEQEKKINSIRRSSSFILSRIDPIHLKPFSTRLEMVLNDTEKITLVPNLLYIWGEVSKKPTPILLRSTTNENTQVRLNASIGLCRILRAENKKLIMHFKNELERSSNSFPIIRTAIVALVRAGQITSVLEIKKSVSEKKKKIFKRILKAIGSSPEVADCY